LQIKLLTHTAKLPVQGSETAAGLDLHASSPKTIPARGKALVETGLSLAIPAGHYGRVAPRSGLAAKFGVETGAGVIDSDYRGPLMVLLFNHSDSDFEIKEGDRIAQLILERISIPVIRQVETLDETVRGAGGFGSTGGFTEPPNKKLKVENGEVKIDSNGTKAE
ncbi:dUTPase-like protein, partial [Papiliotrema laurentii]